MLEIRNGYGQNVENYRGIQSLLDDYVIAVGSEQCSIDFLKSTERLDKGTLTLITPKTDDMHFDGIITRIVDVNNRCNLDSIVINDWGVLECLNEIGIQTKYTIGRVLLGSFGYKESVGDFIHPEENKENVMNILAPSALHKSKIDLFRKYNATAVEVNMLENDKEYTEMLKSYGMNVHAHFDVVLSALSKVCYKANAEHVFCNQECRFPEMLRLVHINKYNPLDKTSMAEDEYNQLLSEFPEYYLVGNAVYRINDGSNCEKTSLYDRIIVDWRFLNIKSNCIT